MKNQLLTLRFPGSFISELQRGDREKMETWDTERAPGSPLLQSLPKPWAWPQSCSESTFTPSLDQGSHLCLTQTTMHPLHFLCRTGEERVVVPPCGHRVDDWTPELPFDLLTRDLPRLSLGSQQWVSAVYTSWCPCSVKFKVWVVFQNTRWHRCFSPLKNQRLWPQRGSDIKAVKPGFQVQGGAHKHTGCSSYQGMRPWTPSSCHFFRPLTRL